MICQRRDFCDCSSRLDGAFRMNIQFFSLCVLTSTLFYSPSQAQRMGLQTGRVLYVEKQEPRTLCCCCYNPTDAPLQSDVFDYDISIQVDDTIYVVRYQTWTGYVPWTTNELIDVKADKHRVYLRTRSGEEMRLPIVGHRISEYQPP